jgi:acid phosphatase (class A)
MSPEMMTLVVSPTLTRAAYPALYRVLDRIGDTAGPVNGTAKTYWNTKRPYLSDARIKSLIPATDSPAYPSGHSAGSYVWAHALGLLLPQYREQFYARAEEIAQHRVLVGLHYPHDVNGGKLQAMLIMGALLQNSSFLKEMDAAKAELAAQSAKN